MKNKQKNNKIKQEYSTYGDKLFLENLFETEKFIKNHNDLIVKISDKGNKIVVLEKERYMNKANNILNDDSTYSIVNYDLINRVLGLIKKILHTIIRQKLYW